MPSEKARKRWEFWFGLIATIAALISIWFSWDERHARILAEQATLAAEQHAQFEATRAEAAEAALRTEKATLKDQLLIFATDYPVRVKALHDAISRYRESQTPENRVLIPAEARALVTLIQKWRALMDKLQSMMDGNITRLEAAAESGNEQAIASISATLDASVQSDINALRAAIDGLHR